MYLILAQKRSARVVFRYLYASNYDFVLIVVRRAFGGLPSGVFGK